jgi:hypothetical protein
MSCTLNLADGRWRPAKDEKMSVVSRSANGSYFRFGGQMDGFTASIVDIKCDARVLEVTLVGPVDADSDKMFGILEKIEKKAMVRNSARLSALKKVELSNNGRAEWNDGDETGEFFLQRTDVSVVVSAYYKQSF